MKFFNFFLLLSLTSILISAQRLEAETSTEDEWAELCENIYLSRSANPTVQKATNLLVEAITLRFGNSPKIHLEPIIPIRKGIHIGHSLADANFDDDPLTDEVYAAISDRGIEISGQDNTATAFAIARFTQQVLGVRYFIPDILGIEILDTPPELEALENNSILLRESPAFHSRNLHSMGRSERSNDWLIYQGLRERFAYNHAFHKQIRPEFFDTHPDWFVQTEDGSPQKPPFPNQSGFNDQPNLLSTSTFDRLFNVASQALKKAVKPDYTVDQSVLLSGDNLENIATVKLTPGIASISFGLHDSYDFGALPEDYEYKPKGFFRRWPDYSNHVFSFSNKLADALSKDWDVFNSTNIEKKDLYFGTLAYLIWENTPDFQVHPNIIPYLTYDRSQWYDPNAKADDIANIKKWNEKGPKLLGTWDYLFGYGFLIPRSMSTIVSEAIPAIYESGIRAYFSQIGATWPFDGHTNWLTAQLLWDPEEDPSALLNQYFSEFYGPAAIPMRQFFDHAENIWMQQEQPGWWLRWWTDPWQASLYQESDLITMRHLLNDALALTIEYEESLNSRMASDRFYKRIQLTSNLFALTENFVRMMQSSWELRTLEINSENAPKALVLANQTLAYRIAFNNIFEQLPKSSPLYQSIRNRPWIDGYETTTSYLLKFIKVLIENNSAEINQNTNVALLLETLNAYQKEMDANAVLLPFSSIQNSSGEMLYDANLDSINNEQAWRTRFLSSENLEVVRDTKNSRLIVQNSKRGFAQTNFKAVPNAVHLASIKGRSNTNNSAQIYIRIDYYDDSFKMIDSSPMARIPPNRNENDPREFSLNVMHPAPQNAAYGRLFIRFFEFNPGTFAEVEKASVIALPVNSED